ncbi:hypothetical protein SAMD00019534_002640 [Acytostelium subglobosum LB1]|uniref:hypothetical protein n=1 Tax=Acytostelium subglobosum LB1 TaxID=1410327 RepID=UPI000644C601|nr:hypothetical protein SAMD00019534_002640 [Acytostelium subglobosum LB1]GAM17089.1 hypothetical protein SAMD00019534_002640 [Acytostelium subglobosum LB1]|eukprot:XP_012759151.1 hypothetical protein SAMD00019534_002640 [Acytostelium subglobosum LB1]
MSTLVVFDHKSSNLLESAKHMNPTMYEVIAEPSDVNSLHATLSNLNTNINAGVLCLYYDEQSINDLLAGRRDDMIQTILSYLVERLDMVSQRRPLFGLLIVTDTYTQPCVIETFTSTIQNNDKFLNLFKCKGATVICQSLSTRELEFNIELITRSNTYDWGHVDGNYSPRTLCGITPISSRNIGQRK